jgi:hypothetical protein
VADGFGRTLTTNAAMAIWAIGFLLTGVTILAIGLIEPSDAGGWRLAWTLLAAGPLVEIAAMLRLRSSPDATKMASGKSLATDRSGLRGRVETRPGRE